MASFTGGPNYNTPFGKTVYLRSTVGVKYESYTVAASTIPTEVVDGVDTKVLQPGSAMAQITSGGEEPRVGPFTLEAGVTDGREDTANLVGLADTFLPTQLLHRDVAISVAYDCTATLANCRELDAAGAWAALSAGTATAMVAQQHMNVQLV